MRGWRGSHRCDETSDCRMSRAGRVKRKVIWEPKPNQRHIRRPYISSRPTSLGSHQPPQPRKAPEESDRGAEDVISRKAPRGGLRRIRCLHGKPNAPLRRRGPRSTDLSHWRSDLLDAQGYGGCGQAHWLAYAERDDAEHRRERRSGVLLRRCSRARGVTKADLSNTGDRCLFGGMGGPGDQRIAGRSGVACAPWC